MDLHHLRCPSCGEEFVLGGPPDQITECPIAMARPGSGLEPCGARLSLVEEAVAHA